MSGFTKTVPMRTTKISVLFVLVGMILLVPLLAEEAQARIDGFGRIQNGQFTNVQGHMDVGSFLSYPKIADNGKQIHWATKGDKFPAGDEKGSVTARVGDARVTVYFNNPKSGPNTCDTRATHGLTVTCSISGGNSATARFNVR
jgi:hypothetical protein